MFITVVCVLFLINVLSLFGCRYTQPIITMFFVCSMLTQPRMTQFRRVKYQDQSSLKIEIVIGVGKAINVSIKEEENSASPPSYNSNAPPKIIINFFLIKIKTNALPDLGVTERENIYTSESLTPFKKKPFGEANKAKKRLRWKHIWIQNGRIFVKEAERTKPVARFYRLVRRPGRI